MVAVMLKSKEKLFRRLCKEPILYFEAYKLLGDEKEAEKVCSIVLERMIGVYPVMKRKSYDDLLYIYQTVIRYICAASLSLVKEINREDVKNDSISNEEYILALVLDCGSDVLLQVLAEMPEDKKCILTLKYAFGLNADVMNTLLGLSHHELINAIWSQCIGYARNFARFCKKDWWILLYTARQPT